MGEKCPKLAWTGNRQIVSVYIYTYSLIVLISDWISSQELDTGGEKFTGGGVSVGANKMALGRIESCWNRWGKSLEKMIASTVRG